MSLKAGIVGLPNVGKSTLFNALTSAKAESANYPFCTIDPNVGMVTVPDTRLSKISELIEPKELIPTTMEFVDIAGLVKGASKGEGLGNQFLANIRETDAIVHVVRCFDDDNIIHVSGSVDPLRDIEVIETELCLSDLEAVTKRIQKVEKAVKSSKNKDDLLELECLKKIEAVLNEGHSVRTINFEKEEQAIVKHMHLITQKPVLFICNVSDADLENGNDWTKQVYDYAEKAGLEALTVCSAMEAEISQLEPEEQKEFLEDLGLEEPGLNRVIRSSYKLLKLNTFFTAGKKEVRAWTIKQGYTAPQAAGVIHTDFEKGFIRAETYHCEDLFELKTEGKVKEAGKYRLEGKEYMVKDGDVLFFRFNV